MRTTNIAKFMILENMHAGTCTQAAFRELEEETGEEIIIRISELLTF